MNEAAELDRSWIFHLDMLQTTLKERGKKKERRKGALGGGEVHTVRVGR